MKILVLDGNSILNRAFYGIKLLTTKNGQYTNAIYGFMNILLRLEESEKPDEIAVAFDLKAPTFRHKMYDGYKAQRKGMPEELAAQMPVLKELLSLLGYQMVSLEGYEADDILGTIAATAAARGEECLLATGDRDSLQLVRPGVTVLLAGTQMGKSITTRMDEAAIEEKYGVTPAQLIEVKALMGDASDNIPGVPGVGEKTAFPLIQKFGTVENLYQNLDDPSIKKGVRQKLADNHDSALLSHKLGVIDCNVPVPTDTGHYAKKPAQTEEASALLTQLEMHTIATRLGLDAQAEQISFSAPVLPEVSALPLTQPLEGTVYLAPSEDKWLVAQGRNIYFAEENNPHLLAMLRSEKAEKHVFDAKLLHRLALAEENGAIPAVSICFDAKLAAYLLNPSGTEYSVARLAGEEAIQPEFICPDYADAPYLQPLFTKLLEDCKEAAMLPLLEDIELPLSEVLASMELVGFRLDAEGVRLFGEELQAELKKQLEAIYELAGVEFNVNSPKQLGEVLFDKMGLPTRRKTKSGWSTDAETLESLQSYSPIIDIILQYRSYQKLNSTYVEGLLKVVGEDGRIHSTFNQTEARTGRISSNEPNLQNIPIRTQLGSRLRKFFIPKEGYELADADYSQIELRILSHISGDEAMQEAFLSGQDIHRATAAKVNGLPPEMVTPQLRSAAKAVNFGIVYGIGAFSLSKDIGVSVKEADAFIKNYLDNFPGVRDYMESTVAFGREHGYVTTLYGRRRPLPELANSNRNIQALGERLAMNTPIQGTAADIIKIAMNRVFFRLREEGLSSRLILQIHDELIVETAPGEEEKVARILHDEMAGAAQLSVPLDADVHMGSNWLDAKE